VCGFKKSVDLPFSKAMQDVDFLRPNFILIPSSKQAGYDIKSLEEPAAYSHLAIPKNT